MNAHRRRVLAIALDSAEPSLVEKWMNDGTLPNLRRLRSNGAYGRLKSSADWLAGSPWPTFYTGTDPAEHGLYETTQWHAERMKHVQTSPEWLPLRPFWREFGENGPRVVSVDLPMTYPPEKFNGIEICGWMTYDSIGNEGKPTSYPAAEIDRLRDEFRLQPVQITCDKSGVQTVKSLLRMRDQVMRATRNTAKLAETLMAHEKWDLFLAAFASPHRGGHKLWDLSGTIGRSSARDRREFSHALRDVYADCDRAVGQLAKAAGDDADILVFSLHGMRANNGRAFLLPRILNSIMHARSKPAPQPSEGHSGFQRIRDWGAAWLPLAFPPSSLPWELGRALYGAQHPRRMLPRRYASAFSLVSCLNGYIRINLRGRERNGVVERGEAYDRLCSAITEDFKTFVDAGTGEPVAEQIVRSDELYGSGSRLDFLPDIIVRWVPTPTVCHRKVVSDRYPSLSIPMPTRNLNGRSGNHSSEGFVLAVGEGIPPGTLMEKGDILDLAPTILAMLGVDKPVQMHGNSMFAKGKDGSTLTR
jgi:predicted AlkP superfamily phosphohydrolase/phosphomutase